MAKKITVTYEVDNSQLDISQKKVDELKKSASEIEANIDVNIVDVEDAKEKLDALKETAGDINLVIGVDTEAIAIAQTNVDELVEAGSNINLDIDVNKTSLDRAQAELESFQDEAKDIQLDVEVDTKQIKSALDDISDLEVGIDVDTSDIDSAKSKIRDLGEVKDVPVYIDVDTADVTSAIGDLDDLEASTQISEVDITVNTSQIDVAKDDLEELEGMTDIPDVLVRAKADEVKKGITDVFLLRDAIDDTPTIDIEVNSEGLDSLRDNLSQVRDQIRSQSKEIRALYAQLYVSEGQNADEILSKIEQLKSVEQELRQQRDDIKNQIKDVRVEASKPITTKIFVNGEEIDAASAQFEELKTELESGASVKIDVEGGTADVISDKFVNLRQQLKLLNTERQKFGEGTKEFTAVSNKIEELNDKLERTNIRGQDLFGTLGALPGPVGQFSLEVDRTTKTLDTFLSFNTDELTNKLRESANAIGDVGKKLLQVTGLTKVYEGTINGLTKAMTALGVAETTAAAAARALTSALALTGIFAIVAGIMALVDAVNQYNAKLERNIELEKERIELLEKRSKAQYEGQSAEIARQTALEESRAQAAGKSDEEVFKIKQNGRKREIKALSDYYNELANKDDDNARATLSRIKDLQNDVFVQENLFKASQLKNKDKEDKKDKDKPDLLGRIRAEKELDLAIENLRRETLLSTEKDALKIIQIREDSARKVNKINVDALNAEAKLYAPDSPEAKSVKANLINLQADLVTQLAGFGNERKAIHLKELNDLLDAMEKETQLANEKYEKYQEEQRFIRIANLQDQMDELAKLNDQLSFDYDADIERLNKQKELLDKQMQIELENTELTEKEKVEIYKKYAKEKAAIDESITNTEKAQWESRYNIALVYAEAIRGVGEIFSMMAGENKKLAKIGLLIEQSAALATIAINAAKNFIKDGGITNPLAIANLVVAGVQAAAVVAATIKGIRDIDKVDASATSSGGSGVSLPSFGSGAQGATPQLGRTQNQVGVLADIVDKAIQRDQSKDRPIRTYIVENDIRTSEQLNRRIRTSARLG